MILESFLFTMVVPYVLLTAGLGVGLYLFFTLKREIARLSAECSNSISGLKAVLSAPAAEPGDLRRDLDRVVPRTRASGLVRWVEGNLRRDRILRLHQQGESPAAIARTLGVPDSQVKLLLKVRSLVEATHQTM